MAADNEPVAFGRRVEEQMTKLGMRTQTQVAAAMGVQQGTLSKWLKGKDLPSSDNIAKAARFLDVDPAQLAADIYVERSQTKSMAERLTALERLVMDLVARQEGRGRR